MANLLFIIHLIEKLLQFLIRVGSSNLILKAREIVCDGEIRLDLEFLQRRQGRDNAIVLRPGLYLLAER